MTVKCAFWCWTGRLSAGKLVQEPRQSRTEEISMDQRALVIRALSSLLQSVYSVKREANSWSSLKFSEVKWGSLGVSWSSWMDVESIFIKDISFKLMLGSAPMLFIRHNSKRYIRASSMFVVSWKKALIHAFLFLVLFFLAWQNLKEKKVENITWENYCEQVSKMGVRKTGTRGVREVDLLFMMQDRGI